MKTELNRTGKSTRRSSMVVASIVLVAACATPQGPPPVTSPERAEARHNDQGSMSMSVALRVTLDAPEDTQRFHLLAVTYDRDGQETTADLGAYVGSVALYEASEGELIRAHINHESGQRTIRLIYRGGYIHAEELHLDAPGEAPRVIESIPVGNGTNVRPSDTPVEQPLPGR